MRVVYPLTALVLMGAAAPHADVAVELPIKLAPDAAGRLLVFAEPATPANAAADSIDVAEPGQPTVSVAARDGASFGKRRIVTVDTERNAFPDGFSALRPGAYRVQVVLDRDGSYAYGGRGPGDLISRVVTLQFPLDTVPSIALDHAVPQELGQFETTGLPPKAAEQILASRAHLHDERIASPLLTHFGGAPRSIAAWVLTPPGYDPSAPNTYPTVFTAGGFGATHRLDGQQLSRQWHLMETGELPPMIWVALDYAGRTGTTEFADSINNGPWGQALVDEVIPTLEARYRMDARPSGRFLTGHSSGGWFALWAIVQHPDFFGGAWATSPDPPAFNNFLGVDLTAPGANMYRDADGASRPFSRDHGATTMTIAQAARLEAVLGHAGGQLRSFEWVFSPKLTNGDPAYMFDRTTGAVDPAVAVYWHDHYDVSHLIATNWPALRPSLDGKLHVVVGTADSLFLDGSVRRLEAAIKAVGGKTDFTYVLGASHHMNEVYAQGTDRNALWKAMTAQMSAIAHPERPPYLPPTNRREIHDLPE